MRAAILLFAVFLSGCSSASKELTMLHNSNIAKSIGKPLVDLKCPLEGCVITGLTVNNPNQAKYIPMPKSAGEVWADRFFSVLPVLGNIWLQDRNGQRSVDMTQINSSTTLGIIDSALGAIPSPTVVDPVVVQPDVVQVPTQVIDQPVVQVIDQPTIQPPFIVAPEIIQVPTP